MKFVSVKELSAIGKSAIGLILTLGALFNVPEVNQVIMKHASAHPHIAITLVIITTLASFFANPQVQKILGVTEVIVPPGSTIQQSTTIQTPPKT